MKIYTAIVLPVVLCGCETWSPTLREASSRRVFDKRVWRRKFGPKRDEGTGEWRNIHNEKLTDLYSKPNIIRTIKPRRMKWEGHAARLKERRSAYRVLVGEPE